MELIGAVYVLRDRPASFCTNLLRDALLAGIHRATAMRAALTLACSGATVALGYAAAMTPATTLLSQQELFDITAEVAYLNCSYLAPQLRSVADAGREANPDGGPVKKATQAEVLIPTKILTKDNVDSPEAKDYLVDRVWTEPGRGDVDFAARPEGPVPLRRLVRR
jgi:hypothetical protein